MSNITHIKKERNRLSKKQQRKIEDQKNKGKPIEPKIVETDKDDEIVFITSSINEVFATSEVVEYFTNNLNKAVELTVSFPLKHEIQLTRFIITIGNKTVISKVLSKEKANEKYTDAIASGNTGILSSFNESFSNYTINIGNVLPNEKVKLTSIYNQMITSHDMSYEFSFLEHYPCFVFEGKKVESKRIEGKFILNTKSKITRLISPLMDEAAEKSTTFEVIFSDNYTQATINFNKNMEIEDINQAPGRTRKRAFNPNQPVPPALLRGRRPLMIGRQIQPINNVIINNTVFNNPAQFPGLRNRFTSLNYFSFLFRTEKMNIPTLYLQYDPETKETAYCLNYVYCSKNVKNIPVPEKPDQDNKVSYYEKYQENLINETPGLFIFLVDQSGSMRGNSISLVKKALTLFIQSLPPKSYFQLIGFGSNFHKYNPTPVEYNKENVKNIISQINGLEASMGGTNISSPLKDIFENKDKIYENIPLSKNIFLLTDGQVNNRESCINLIATNANRFRIHAMGIGNDFDKLLIERSGKVGKGTSSFVEDVNKINEVVIDTLNKCLRPYLVDLKFSFNNDSLIKAPILVNEPINNFTYQDEVVNYSFILGQKNKINLSSPIKVDIRAKDPLKEIGESFNLSSPENIVSLNNGDNLIKNIIGLGLKYNKNLLESTEKEIEFAKKYQLLSKNTALFAEILKDGSSPQSELIKVNLNNERQIKPKANVAMGIGRPRIYSGTRIMKRKCMPVSLAINTLSLAAKRAKGLKEISLGTNSKKKLVEKCAVKKPTNVINNVSSNNTKNSYEKKCSFTQRDDGSIGIIDEFNDMIMTQDIIEGSWNENKETNKLIDKVKSENFEKIVNHVKIMDLGLDSVKIIYTILVIYYIYKHKSKNINEYRLVINKGKRYLSTKGINYDEEINEIFK
jgi:uncharacterized protein YegL